MDNQDSKNFSEDSIRATPFNVDFFSPSGENFFEEYTKKVTPLSASIKNVLMDDSTTNFVEEDLGSTFGLNLEQKTEVLRIVRDILLGDLFAGDMIVTIAQKLNVDQTTAQQIRDKIVKELFAPAIEDIKKIQRERFPDRTKQGTAPQPPAPPQIKTVPAVNQGNVIDLRKS